MLSLASLLAIASIVIIGRETLIADFVGIPLLINQGIRFIPATDGLGDIAYAVLCCTLLSVMMITSAAIVYVCQPAARIDTHETPTA